MKIQKLTNTTTFNVISIVENTLKNMNNSIITITELKHRLPRQVNYNTLKVILKHLENNNKIVITKRGITWIYGSIRDEKEHFNTCMKLLE